MTVPRIWVGLDPSLTGTGMVILDQDGNLLHAARYGYKGTKAADLVFRRARIDAITQAVDDALPPARAQVPILTGAALEAPMFYMKGGHIEDRYHLWWRLAGLLLDRGVMPASVPPATLKKHATGSGRADKAGMIAAAPNTITDDNIADAYHLATWSALNA